MIPLRLDNLKPGMMLTESVYNFQGVLLLRAGSVLTEENIRILKSWGVQKVSVEGKSPENDNHENRSRKKYRAAITKLLEAKFKEIPKDPVITEIMRVSADILEQRLLVKEGENELR